MRRLLIALALAASAATLSAQAPTPAADPLAPLDFLLGTWTAKSDAAAGSANASANGLYTFRRDLGGHALQRTSSADKCSGPATFDCNHNDQLTTYADPKQKGALAALYLDSEGHAIHYAVTIPDPDTAIFLSQPSPYLPQFRLLYHLEGDGSKAVMTGKFQVAAPGSSDFHSYLEWSGTKQ